MKDGLEVSFKRLCKLDATVNNFIVRNLKENREYDFRLFAVNDAGASTRPAQLDGIKTILPFGKFYTKDKVNIYQYFISH